MRCLLTLFFLGLLAGAGHAESPGRAVSDFGFDYFGQTAEAENMVCSPLSIHAAFAMLNLGAAGDTQAEAAKVLRLSDSQTRSYASYVKDLTPEVGQLALASRLWPSVNFQLKQSYLQDCASSFGAAPESLDYKNSENARQTINKWVSEHTQQEIEELIPRLNAGVSLVLSNALYFKGQWAQPFHEQGTAPGPFQTPNGTVQAPMMRGLFPALYFQNKDLEVVSLPYLESNLAMALILPRQNDGWKTLRKDLTNELLYQVEDSQSKPGMGSDRIGKMQITLPKFKVRQESQPLTTLRSMGMTQLLSANPDLSRLSESGGLFVSDCFHQAVVEVDEKGTKAAAATAIVVTRSTPQVRATVHFDRPFFFIVYDRENLAPLFIGRVTDPTK
jgi:leukocyte elastase inhibitor